MSIGLKKYIIASLVFLSIVAVFSFRLLGFDTYHLDLLFTEFDLPVFATVLVPVSALLVFTVAHMLYYMFKNYLAHRLIEKDFENILELIKLKLLKSNTSELEFQTQIASQIKDTISQLSINVDDINFDTQSKMINDTVEQVIKIKSGTYVSSKTLELDADSSLMNKNLCNKAEIDNVFAREVIVNNSEYSNEVIQKAFVEFIKKSTILEITEILEGVTLNTFMAKELFKIDSMQDVGESLDKDIIVKTIGNLDFTVPELLNIIKQYKHTMSPEQLLKIVEEISDENEKYSECFIYLLLEYGLIEQAKDVLLNSQKDEFLVFKALIDLKEMGKHYSLNDLYKSK
jgi:hypothetical protein